MNKNALAVSIAALFTVGVATFSYFQFAGAVGGADPKNTHQVALGKQVYDQNCASCHGADFEGEDPDWKRTKEDGTLYAPPHNGDGHTWHHGDQLLFKYVKEGGQAIAGKDFKSAMQPFSKSLSDEKIWAALAYIKTSWKEKQLEFQTKVSEQEKSQ